MAGTPQSPLTKRDTFHESLLEQLIAKYASPTRTSAAASRMRYYRSNALSSPTHDQQSEVDDVSVRHPSSPTTLEADGAARFPLFSDVRALEGSRTPVGWPTSARAAALSTIAKPQNADMHHSWLHITPVYPTPAQPRVRIAESTTQLGSGGPWNGFRDVAEEAHANSTLKRRLAPEPEQAVTSSSLYVSRGDEYDATERHSSRRLDWLERRVIELQTQLHSVTQQKDQLAQQLRSLSATNDSLQVEVGKKGLVINDLKESHNAQLELFHKAVAAHEQRTAHLKQALQETEKQKATTENQCKEMLAMCEQQQVAIQELQSRVATLTKTLAAAEKREAQARELEQRLRTLLLAK